MTCHKREKSPKEVSKSISSSKEFMESCITLACGWEISLLLQRSYSICFF